MNCPYFWIVPKHQSKNRVNQKKKHAPKQLKSVWMCQKHIKLIKKNFKIKYNKKNTIKITISLVRRNFSVFFFQIKIHKTPFVFNWNSQNYFVELLLVMCVLIENTQRFLCKLFVSLIVFNFFNEICVCLAKLLLFWGWMMCIACPEVFEIFCIFFPLFIIEFSRLYIYIPIIISRAFYKLYKLYNITQKGSHFCFFDFILYWKTIQIPLRRDGSLSLRRF